MKIGEDGAKLGKGNKLKVLDLSCAKFRKTPDLSIFQSLERLTLMDCARLVEIDPSIGKLKDLKFLNVSGCKSLKGFPNELCSLSHLEVVLGYDYGELFASSKVSFFSHGLKNQQRYLNHHYTSEVELLYLPDSIGNIRLLTLVSWCP